MGKTIELLKALTTLCAQANFNCNAEGATKIAAIMQAADRHIKDLENPNVPQSIKKGKAND